MDLTAKILCEQACKQESEEAEVEHLQGLNSRRVKVVAQRMMIAKRDNDKLEKALSCCQVVRSE
jgi:hypothetical protein